MLVAKVVIKSVAMKKCHIKRRSLFVTGSKQPCRAVNFYFDRMISIIRDGITVSKPAAAGSRFNIGLMNIIKKTSLASGGTTEKRIAYLFVVMERELKDLQFYVCSVS